MSQSGKLTPNLDKESTKLLNLTVLQRMDSFIEEILITAAHVTCYEFNIERNAWSRKDVEGSLFVVKRNTQPRFQFIVMNRRSTENLVENLLGDFEYELQLPYLLYKNAAQDVNGIWFYNEQECEDVANLFNRILNAYSKVPLKSKVPSRKGDLVELEEVPTMSAVAVEVPLEDTASTSSSLPQDPAFINFFSAAMDIGGNSSKTTNVQLPYYPSANISPTLLPPTVASTSAPSQQAPLFSATTSSTPFPLYGMPDTVSNTRATDLVKPSNFFLPSSSPSALVMPSNASSAQMVASLHPLNIQHPYGTSMLQPFPPPTPPASLTPGSIPTLDVRPFISRERVRDAIRILVQDDQFIDKFYQALQKAQHGGCC